MYLKLIRKFNSSEKITVYFETSYSAGIYINEYLRGNEIFPLKEFVEDYRGTMFGTTELMNFIITLRKYYQRAKNKFAFIGIDLEFQKNITEKMLKYTSLNKNSDIYRRILRNRQNTEHLAHLDDAHFEVEREEILTQNFLELYHDTINALCFMGAWHTRIRSNDKNFSKEIKKHHFNVLSIELMYQNSRRTIKEDGVFKSIQIDDKYDKEKYSMYGRFGIMKEDTSQGVLVLDNCNSLDMMFHTCPQ
ncbi:MAG: hypothetical protein IJ867_04785 [Clostridia bacterium]|nr:hypothetical protein [Clostridia bacterium]